mgnify:CR=1 FL=1
MAFIKLDCAMLDSSVWINPNLTRVFLTCLLMARPVEYKTNQITFQLESTDEVTDFVVPAGRYGFCAIAANALIRRAQMQDHEAIALKAIQELMDPDPYSRTTTYEGRRIARVMGGFVVLNYDQYRSKDHTAADRSRRYRENRSSQ